MAAAIGPTGSQSIQGDDPGPRRDLPGAKLRENVSGKYYVTDQCNACGLCKSVADPLFDFNNEGTYYFVVRQPVNAAEQEMMDEAIAFCTANALWWDGRKVE